MRDVGVGGTDALEGERRATGMVQQGEGFKKNGDGEAQGVFEGDDGGGGGAPLGEYLLQRLFAGEVPAGGHPKVQRGQLEGVAKE